MGYEIRTRSGVVIARISTANDARAKYVATKKDVGPEHNNRLNWGHFFTIGFRSALQGRAWTSTFRLNAFLVNIRETENAGSIG